MLLRSTFYHNALYSLDKTVNFLLGLNYFNAILSDTFWHVYTISPTFYAILDLRIMGLSAPLKFGQTEVSYNAVQS